MFPLKFGVIIFNVLFNVNFWYQQDSNSWSKAGSIGDGASGLLMAGIVKIVHKCSENFYF